MVPAIALMACPALAVPANVMHHVVQVESSFNPYAIGVVGGRLVRQPRTLAEAVATARMLESRGFNFSLGLAQVNRYNLARYGLDSYQRAFDACPNLQAGSRILADCRARAGGDWGRAFSCYYSGNFVTGYRTGYVRKVFASMQAAAPAASFPGAIPLAVVPSRRSAATARAIGRRDSGWTRRTAGTATRIDAAIPPARTMADAVTAPPPTGEPPRAPDASVAVLDAGGRPPVLVERAPSTPSPATNRPVPDAARGDAAFVF